MALMIGRHVHRIDKKGRVSTPKTFRNVLAAQGFDGLYAFPTFKFPAIEACGDEFMGRLGTGLDDLEMFSDEQDDLASIILENAHALSFDPEGRIVLPKELLVFAGIATQALFVGRGTRLQIWHPDTYEKHRAQAFDRARARGATLRLRDVSFTDGSS